MDGLWAGEEEGPLKPSAKVAGVLMAGVDSVFVDLVAATLMGFDYRKIKLLTGALTVRDYQLASGSVDCVALASNDPVWASLGGVARHHLAFKPPRGWVGHIELGPSVPPGEASAAVASRNVA